MAVDETMTEPLPWQRAAWDRLQAVRRGGRLPHALLLCGPEGVGKAGFATLLARSLLCRRPASDGLPCGRCDDCALALAGTHPDVRLCEPEIDKKTERERLAIGIDQIREVADFVALKAHRDGHKVVVIRPAERLNPFAANSLLKTLEEPPGASVLILVTAHPGALPATVRSRCQRLPIGLPDPAAGTAWLASRLGAGTDAGLLLGLAGGAPLAALALHRDGVLAQRTAMLEDLLAVVQGRSDPLRLAEEWLKFGLKESLYWLYVWLVDMVRLKATDEPPFMSGRDQRDLLRALSADAAPRSLLRRMDRVLGAMRALDGHANPQLLLEDALLSWAEKP
jgi:DNA polymerase-3 subunit delta'